MIETINGHRYEVTRDGQGNIVKLEGRDQSASTVDLEKDAAILLANKGTSLTLTEIGKLVQFLVKRTT